jgi:hypothetical protein
VDTDDPPCTFALPELAEAAARTGNTQLAAHAVDQLAETTQPGGTGGGLGIEARCRALVSQGRAAEDPYREAIDRSARTRPALTCCTANGCAARTAASTPGNSSGPPMACWTRWGWRPSPNGPGVSC